MNVILKKACKAMLTSSTSKSIFRDQVVSVKEA